MVCGAAVDRHEDDRQKHRAVFRFLDTTKDRRPEEESRSVSAHHRGAQPGGGG
ncbi:unnamed protein product [Tetraodon nigroviridis]|uniref:(spotted green pufferfish) hypothetical protein n=1 Tax=Tetraodon nigroviridis TaxID=99883 RepID=Q4SJN7_TETNG|nr:unnamed protein product [Tetraodon nigroviridis]